MQCVFSFPPAAAAAAAIDAPIGISGSETEGQFSRQNAPSSLPSFLPSLFPSFPPSLSPLSEAGYYSSVNLAHVRPTGCISECDIGGFCFFFKDYS